METVWLTQWQIGIVRDLEAEAVQQHQLSALMDPAQPVSLAWDRLLGIAAVSMDIVARQMSIAELDVSQLEARVEAQVRPRNHPWGHLQHPP